MQQVPTTNVTLYIRTVWLAVRFNCKLAFTLKNDSGELLATADATYPLTRGEAHINDALSFSLPTHSLPLPKPLKLSVVLSSANGIVPAGHALISIPLAQTPPTTLTLPLYRCEDRQAQLKLTIAFNTSPQVILDLTPSQAREIRPEKMMQEAAGRSPYQRLPWLGRQSYSASKVRRFQFGRERHRDIRPQQSPSKKDGHEVGVSNEQLLKEHQDYWLEIVRLQGVTDSLRLEVQSLKAENEQLRCQNEGARLQGQKVHALVSEVHENNNSINRLEAEYARLEMAIAEKHNQLEESQQQFQETTLSLQSQVDSSKLENALLMDTLKKVQQSHSKLEQSSLALEVSLRGVEQQLLLSRAEGREAESKWFQQLSQTRRQLEVAEAQRQQSEREKLELEKSFQIQTNHIQSLKLQIEKEREVSQKNIELINQKEKEIQRKAQQIQTLGLSIKKQQSLNATLREELQSYVHRETVLEEAKLSLSAQLLELRDKEGQLENKLSSLQQEMQLMSQEILKEQTQKQTIASILADTQNQLQVSRTTQLAEVTILSEQLAQSKTRLQQFQQRFALLQRQKEQATAEADSARNSCNRIEELFEESQAELSMAQAELEKLQQQNQHDYSSSYGKSITQLTVGQARAERENEQLAKDKEQLETALQALKSSGRSRVEALEREMAEVKAFAHTKLQEILLLRKEKQELEAKLTAQ